MANEDEKRKSGAATGAVRRGADRFLEACLLQLLQHDAGHGYALMEPLAQFGFTPENVNASTLYRTLRGMEKKGWLSSDWETGGRGPRRRVYLVTPEGTAELKERIATMRQRLVGIQRLVDIHTAGADGRT
ncbi:MAG: PadR family transcriptional regulator [Clostridiales bacterium]|nr:PadR family transcriptional regulator [Clostridiales bacterium]